MLSGHPSNFRENYSFLHFFPGWTLMLLPCAILSKFRKIWILIKKFGKNLHFGHNFLPLLTSVKIVEKSRFLSKLSKNLNFSQNCRKISILVKILKNFYLIQNFQKFPILVKKITKNINWEKIIANLDFGQIFFLIFLKSRCWSKFSKILNLVKFSKILTSVKKI